MNHTLVENVVPIITKHLAALFKEDLKTTDLAESVTEAATILETSIEIESNTEIPEQGDLK